MPKTITLRIPVAVDREGRAYAYAWRDETGTVGPRNFDELLETSDLDSVGPDGMFWVTVDLIIPEAPEIKATAIPANA